MLPNLNDLWHKGTQHAVSHNQNIKFYFFGQLTSKDDPIVHY